MSICCFKCYNNEKWKETISDSIFKADCSFCNEENVECFEVFKFVDFLKDTVLEGWAEFNFQIRHQRRFIFDFDYSDVIYHAEQLFSTILPSGTQLFRARLGGQKENNNGLGTIKPYPPDEMLNPPFEKTQNGRANSIGIPYIYAAMDKQTAITEVRPWINAPISLMTFYFNKKLKIIDRINFVMHSR